MPISCCYLGNNRCILLERKLRRNNIIVFGLNFSTDNLVEETLNILNTHLKTSFVVADINNIRKIGKGQRQTVILEFVSFLKKSQVFKNIRNLKGTSIAIANDLCVEDRENNKVLVRYLKKAKAEGIRAQIRGDRLEIDGKTYTVTELKNLHEGEFISESEDGENEVEATSATPFVNAAAAPLPGGSSTKRKRRKILKSSPPKPVVTTRSKK